MGVSLPSRRVVGARNKLLAVHGRPQAAVRVDNGPELTARPPSSGQPSMASMHHIQSGKPDQNAYIERFNRSDRTELLNAHLFASTADLKALRKPSAQNLQQRTASRSLGRFGRLRFRRGQHQRISLRIRAVGLTGKLSVALETLRGCTKSSRVISLCLGDRAG